MRTRRSIWLIAISLTALALLVAACGPAAEPTPEPTATRPLRPTFTPTPVQTDTPTPLPPTPTDTPTEPATPTPTELPTDTPEPATPTPEPEPVVVVSGSAQVNVRSGPGTAYSTVGSVARGTELKIVARNEAGDWWQVCCVSGQEVWIVDRLVEINGDTQDVQIATNVAAPPTPRPVPPTNTPAPTPTPAPVYAFEKYANPAGRPNSNAVITFFGMVYSPDLLKGVGGVKLVVEGPLGRQEGNCADAVLRGDPGLASEFIYNCKVEFMGSADGVYRAWIADSGGAQQSDVWENSVAGEIRTFQPRWKQR